MIEINRVRQFRNDGLGIFIHFGLYNKLKKGEWYQNMYKLNTCEYLKIFGELKEVEINLDIKQIVSFAKENGFKYITLTTKHHDGFALYDSEGTSDLDITMIKSKIDFVQEFINECLKQEIKPFLYYATWDWSQESFDKDFDKYLKYVYENIEFICKKYKGVSGYWFDGNWIKKDADWKVQELYKMIRTYNPDAMIINNSGMANAGVEQNWEVDSITFEQGMLSKINYTNFKRDLAAEVSQTFNDHWGYAKEDFNYKSVKDLIIKYLLARKNKANYLLNLSVDNNGNLINLEKELVKKFSEWKKKYAHFLQSEYDVIYSQDNDFIVKTKEGKTYVFLYDVVSGGHVKKIQEGGLFQEQRNYIVDLKKIQKIVSLDNDTEHEFELKDGNLTINVKAFDYGFNTIVRVLEIKEK